MTACAGGAQEDIYFFTCIVGQRLAKQTAEAARPFGPRRRAKRVALAGRALRATCGLRLARAIHLAFAGMRGWSAFAGCHWELAAGRRGRAVARCALWAAALSMLLAAAASAQMEQTLVSEKTLTRVSEHVWALVGFPNIGIVVGDRATLVIDTGLGERNGATVARVEQKLARGSVLYLTTTHYHSEHTTGEQAFPPNTVLIRPVEQQQELLQRLPGHMARFRQMSEQNKELLADVRMRTPDILFNGGMKLDLGGVTARLFLLGPAHTQGDMLIFVEEDSVLLPGDVVESRLFPIMPEESTMKGWIAVLDKLEPVKPRLIVPDHGELGDGSLIQKEKAMLVELQGRALELKHEGKSADEVGRLLTEELHAKHPDYGNVERIAADVKLVYAEDR
jgi:glyoxylase-like metal-dependent hydrolase (beta-lactamase superfamily II)